MVRVVGRTVGRSVGDFHLVIKQDITSLKIQMDTMSKNVSQLKMLCSKLVVIICIFRTGTTIRLFSNIRLVYSFSY